MDTARLNSTGASGPVTPDLHAAGTPRPWWREPRLTWWLLAVFAVLLVLRKPHALHTPQLYAEDGTIFLLENDFLGWRAFLAPYMGYLHTLPRIIAWLASRLLDPAWWPAFYNGAALAVTLALFARFMSARLDLPGKPWLVAAFFLGANTGEVLLNITNLQWLTAFFLLQHVLITRPATNTQRAGDLTILALAGLTGPFVIAWVPLFAWRWWRDRRGDNLAALAVAGGCAAVQVWFVVTTGPQFEFQTEPFNALTFFTVLARRLIIWPLAGADAALSLPPAIVAAAGCTLLAAIVGWALRPGPRREQRTIVVAALVLMTLAGIYRSRPDLWGGDNLVYSDRYFYIPRVLVAWLLIWEFNAIPRAVGYAARMLCVAGVLANLPGYVQPAPPDYRWSEHCEPIRRGVPADIPTLPEGWTLHYKGRKSCTE
jgi:hypothetical protein